MTRKQYLVIELSLVLSMPFTVSLCTWLHDAHTPSWLMNGVVTFAMMKGVAAIFGGIWLMTEWSSLQ